MLSKTYRGDDWAAETDPYELKKQPKRRRRQPSQKELLDSLEEHNDGYIPTEVDDLARDE